LIVDRSVAVDARDGIGLAESSTIRCDRNLEVTMFTCALASFTDRFSGPPSNIAFICPAHGGEDGLFEAQDPGLEGGDLS
jgi:hypothetical protein